MVLAAVSLLLGFFLAFMSAGSFIAIYANKLPNQAALWQLVYATLFATAAFYLISYGVN